MSIMKLKLVFTHPRKTPQTTTKVIEKNPNRTLAQLNKITNTVK